MLMDTNNWSINSAYGEEIYSNFYPLFQVNYQDAIYQSILVWIFFRYCIDP